MKPAGRAGPRPVRERVGRLLVMLPWLMQRGKVAVSEMAATFGLSERELVRDLETASLCGLPPYVDELIDLYVDDGWVHAGVPRVFTRPPRLSAEEGFTLLAAGRAALELPGADPTGPLARAPLVVAEAGEGAVVEREVDGGVVLRVPAGNDLAFRGWLLELGDHAEVLAPPGVRKSFVAWLEVVAAGHGPS